MANSSRMVCWIWVVIADMSMGAGAGVCSWVSSPPQAKIRKVMVSSAAKVVRVESLHAVTYRGILFTYGTSIS